MFTSELRPRTLGPVLPLTSSVCLQLGDFYLELHWDFQSWGESSERDPTSRVIYRRCLLLIRFNSSRFHFTANVASEGVSHVQPPPGYSRMKVLNNEASRVYSFPAVCCRGSSSWPSKRAFSIFSQRFTRLYLLPPQCRCSPEFCPRTPARSTSRASTSGKSRKVTFPRRGGLGGGGLDVGASALLMDKAQLSLWRVLWRSLPAPGCPHLVFRRSPYYSGAGV